MNKAIIPGRIVSENQANRSIPKIQDIAWREDFLNWESSP